LTAHWSKKTNSCSTFRQFHITAHDYPNQDLVEMHVVADGFRDDATGYEVLEGGVEYALRQLLDEIAGDKQAIIVWNKAVCMDDAIAETGDDDIDYYGDGDFTKLD